MTAMNCISVPIQVLDITIERPSVAYHGDAGFDLRSTINVTLAPFERCTIPCGIAIELPEGFAGLVLPRSGLASRHGISLVNGPGLIDSGFRGEIHAVLVNLDPSESFTIHRGDRIAQLTIISVPPVTLLPTQQLVESERGAHGFGSSGR